MMLLWIERLLAGIKITVSPDIVIIVVSGLIVIALRFK